MATFNGKYKVKNSKNSYDIIHLETSASQVKFNDGSNFQEKLDSGVLTGPKGPKGDKGSDGLTTSVTVNGTKYSHLSGNITIPDYPTLSSLGAEPKNTNIQAHISSAHAPSNAQKNSDITKSEIEAKLTGTITTHTHNNVSTTNNGLMSKEDKIKLDGIEECANYYVHPTGNGNLHLPTSNSSNNGDFLKITDFVTGEAEWTSIEFSDIQNTPTTLEGYGITNAANKSETEQRFIAIEENLNRKETITDLDIESVMNFILKGE